MFKLKEVAPPTAYKIPFTTPTPNPLRAVGMGALVVQFKFNPIPTPQFVGVIVAVNVFVIVGVIVVVGVSVNVGKVPVGV